MVGCTKFCKGGKETEDSLVAQKLYKDVAKDLHLESFNKQGQYLCPFGCTCNPTTGKATENAKNNSGLASICHQNIWREYL